MFLLPKDHENYKNNDFCKYLALCFETTNDILTKSLHKCILDQIIIIQTRFLKMLKIKPILDVNFLQNKWLQFLLIGLYLSQ